MSEDGVARDLTHDHKPDIPGERDRIYRAGGAGREAGKGGGGEAGEEVFGWKIGGARR